MKTEPALLDLILVQSLDEGFLLREDAPKRLVLGSVALQLALLFSNHRLEFLLAPCT